jgi:hypothetical protein
MICDSDTLDLSLAWKFVIPMNLSFSMHGRGLERTENTTRFVP